MQFNAWCAAHARAANPFQFKDGLNQPLISGGVCFSNRCRALEKSRLLGAKIDLVES